MEDFPLTLLEETQTLAITAVPPTRFRELKPRSPETKVTLSDPD